MGYFFSFIWAGADIGYFMGWGVGIQNFKTRSWGYSKLPVETERWVDDSMGS
jgi:hypothetical protein